jgi:hypothetical protein
VCVQAVLSEAHAAWRPTGLLSDAEARRALSAAIELLKSLHAYAHLWAPTPAQLLEMQQVGSDSEAEMGNFQLHMSSYVGIFFCL